MSYQPSQLVRDIHVALKSILNAITRPMWVDPTTSRAKADAVITGGTLPTVTTVTGVTTVTTVTTVGTVTTAATLTNLGTANVTGQFIDRLAWANTIRARIT